MNRLFQYIRGYTLVEICGASPQTALNKMVQGAVGFWNIRWIDPLTVRVCVWRKDLPKAMEIANSSMCDGKEIKSAGLYLLLSGIIGRPVLLLFIGMTAAAAVILPQFVLFYDVTGAEHIPEEKILWQLQELGLKPGIYGPNIHPHQIKNKLLRRMPELQWVTVTQNGCRAEIIVRERNVMPETKTKKGYANVVATQSGIITSQSVLAGQPQFSVGDTVNRGDVLVSGIVDLERIYVIENAEAEVFARTWRKKSVCIPRDHVRKERMIDEIHCLWLILGEKRIKIFGNSGISYDSCVKMVSKMALVLPGGLSLPCSLEFETVSVYKESVVTMEEEGARELLFNGVVEAVEKQMQAGEILKTSDRILRKPACYQLDVTLECHEMIAEAIPAKWNYEELVHD